MVEGFFYLNRFKTLYIQTKSANLKTDYTPY